MHNPIYAQIASSSSQAVRQLAVLIDPDKADEEDVLKFSHWANKYKADYIFTGGSLITNDFMGTCIRILKQTSEIPVIIFPGNNMQIFPEADAILLLSMISGRNPELLIGNHVIAAPYLKESGLEIIPTGYMLIESGKITSVAYMSNTLPIPSDKPDIAASTALAGEMLGLKLMYMDAGSGALKPVSAEMIRQVKNNINCPLIVGGGIRSAQEAEKIWDAGADILVVGNATEKNPEFISRLCETRNKLNETSFIS